MPRSLQDRLLLVVDGDKTSLGETALRLVRLGVPTVHAADLDEAELMARQDGGRIGALLMPACVSDERMGQVLERVGVHTGLATRRIALLGTEPPPERVAELKECGCVWRVWEPWDDGDLRFVARTVLWSETDNDLRLDPRIPTELPGMVSRRGASHAVTVVDLSISGARIESKQAVEVGCPIGLEVAVMKSLLTVKAVVRWIAEPSSGATALPRGYGVEFVDPPEAVCHTLEAYVQEQTARFRM